MYLKCANPLLVPASRFSLKGAREVAENSFTYTRTAEQCEPNIVQLDIQINSDRPQLQMGTDGPDNEAGGHHGKIQRKVKKRQRGAPILMDE